MPVTNKRKRVNTIQKFRIRNHNEQNQQFNNNDTITKSSIFDTLLPQHKKEYTKVADTHRRGNMMKCRTTTPKQHKNRKI